MRTPDQPGVLHQLERDRVGGGRLRDGQHVVCVEDAFVRQQRRRAGPGAQPRHGADVPGRHGLLDQPNAHLGELRQAAHRHGLVPGLVGVDDQLGAALQRAGEVAHAGHVGLGRLRADLDLEGAMQAGLELALGLLHLLRRVAGGESPEHGDAVPHRAAEQGGRRAGRSVLPTASNSAVSIAALAALLRLAAWSMRMPAASNRSARWPMMAGAR